MSEKKGHFGMHGGQYIPETLMNAVQELDAAYEHYKHDPGFQAELTALLNDYAGRPSRLYYAGKVTADLGGAKVYLKREDLNHTGAHKINNVLGQALLAKRMGKTRLIAETGAGQHGVATATAALMGMECVVFMGEEDTKRQALNVYRMRLLGAEVVPVTSGTGTLKDACSAAFREWTNRISDTHYCIGSVMGPHPFPTMVRDFQAVISKEIKEQLLEKDDECRQIIASPVEQDGQIAGAVLVILDVTEKEQRERLRREFTANVSHELKTPLTSILGTAEILQNGLVKPEDVPHFAGNIHRETERLIGLVNDIIKLSRLDEGGGLGQWETVDLYEEARAVLEQLAPAAQRKQVTTRLQGGEALVRGVPQIVEEIVYNLCDNAIAYNRANGSVTVTVENTAFGPRITVADTGIGIPREAQGRVFERFYRVDKSHSSGGTGLGLSIVKHGAAYLGAQVELHSEPGHGSTFTLTFPKAGA